MLSDIRAECVENDLANLTAWDQHSDQNETIHYDEIEVDTPLSMNSFLQQFREKMALFLPLTVTRGDRVLPFLATETLEAGDQVTILRSGDATEQIMA